MSMQKLNFTYFSENIKNPEKSYGAFTSHHMLFACKDRNLRLFVILRNRVDKMTKSHQPPSQLASFNVSKASAVFVNKFNFYK